MAAPIQLFLDYASQPSRSVLWFCLLTKIPHTVREVRIAKGEHKTPEYAQINPFQKVPAVKDGDFTVWESHTILRYLSTKAVDISPSNDHWYPQDIKNRTQVDRYLDWHHTGMRAPMLNYFQTKWLKPMTKQHVEPSEIKAVEVKAAEALQILEDIWLKNNPYLAGSEVTIADLLCVNELTSASLAGLDINEKGGPKTQQWSKSMKQLPYFQDIHSVLFKWAQKTPNSKL